MNLNLDINSYSKQQLIKNFKLSENYSSEQLTQSIENLKNSAGKTLGHMDKKKFIVFLEQARTRLMVQEYSTSGQEFLPSNRELTMLPPAAAPELPPVSASASAPLPKPAPQQWSDLNLKNTMKRMITIDSQYRQYISINGLPEQKSNTFNTDFTIDFSEPLSNVTSIKLYNISIPTTWYVFDDSLDNRKFTIDGSTFEIPVGNYQAIDDLLDVMTTISGATFEKNKNTNQVVISGCNTFTYYDKSGEKGGRFLNQNIGWMLGFRRKPVDNMITVDVSKDGNGDAPINIYGPTYFMLSLDDYNQNQRNKGLLYITDDHSPIQTITPAGTIPFARNPTNAQLLTETALTLRNSSPDLRIPNPKMPDAFAMIPIKTTVFSEEPYVFNDLNLQDNIRTYSGPVNIDRLRIRLFDDKGNLVNLHDVDWSISLIVDQLY